MKRRIAIIDGHPDPDGKRLVHALADTYAKGAQEVGHEVRRINVAELQMPLLRTAQDFQSGKPSAEVLGCQEILAWAEHWVIFYPLWLGAMPALLKGFFEQTCRPGFAFAESRGRGLPHELGKTAH